MVEKRFLRVPVILGAIALKVHCMQRQPHHNTGTLLNNPEWTGGRLGSAIIFGNNRHVSIPNSAGLDITDQITAGAWVGMP